MHVPTTHTDPIIAAIARHREAAAALRALHRGYADE
jgi:hypothetical protein